MKIYTLVKWYYDDSAGDFSYAFDIIAAFNSWPTADKIEEKLRKVTASTAVPEVSRILHEKGIHEKWGYEITSYKLESGE